MSQNTVILFASSMTATLLPPLGVSSEADSKRHPYRVLGIAAHPVQYASPVFRHMALRPELDFQVAYCSLRGVEPGLDREFGRTVQWDVPLLDGYRWTLVPNRGSGGEGFFEYCNTGLWKLIREGEFDAILCWTGYLRASFWIAYLAARVTGTAFLFGTDATTLHPMTGPAWKQSVKRAVWPLLFRAADQVIVPSSGARELMVSLGIPAECVTLTPYSVDNDWWRARSAEVDRKAVRDSWGVADGDFVVLFCAKLQPWKRPLDLLRAFARADLPGAVLVFAGEGPLREQVEAEAAELGVSNRIKLLGFVNQSRLPAVYTAADLLVLPSEYEAFGVVVNEAMLCGCVVAASANVGAARDLIAPGKTGYLFPCGDVDALASVLREVATDRARLARISQAARERMATWSFRENVQATVDAVERAAYRKFPRNQIEGGGAQSYR